MKNIILLLFLIMCPGFIMSQAVSINTDGSLPNSKAILDVKSTLKGMLAPRMNTAARLLIAPAASEEGLMVFDTDLNKYMVYTGVAWEVIGDGHWTPHTNGLYRLGRIGINALPDTRTHLFVHGTGAVGPDTSVAYILRNGSSNSNEGGTDFTVSGIDAAIKGYALWGNKFSTGVAAYTFLDYNQSSALIASNQNATLYALLAYKDANGKNWSGYFNGDARVSGQLGVGVTPGNFTVFQSETSVYDRSGYFINSKNTPNVTYGIYAAANGTGAGAKRAAAFDATGGTGINMAIRAFASGGSAAWAGYFAAGNVYINDNLAINTETMATGYALSVNGKIISTELRIQDMIDWPDYVFEKNYPLPTLTEVEASIQRDKHLPGVPSAATVADEGILVGEMNAILLKKIEELTLYVIAQQKQLEHQQQQITALEKQLHKE